MRPHFETLLFPSGPLPLCVCIPRLALRLIATVVAFKGEEYTYIAFVLQLLRALMLCFRQHFAYVSGSLVVLEFQCPCSIV